MLIAAPLFYFILFYFYLIAFSFHGSLGGGAGSYLRGSVHPWISCQLITGHLRILGGIRDLVQGYLGSSALKVYWHLLCYGTLYIFYPQLRLDPRSLCFPAQHHYRLFFFVCLVFKSVSDFLFSIKLILLRKQP